MRRALFLSLSLLLLVPLSQAQHASAPAAKKTAPQKKSAPKPQVHYADPVEVRLLEESHSAGASLDVDERAHLLIEQCSAAEALKQLGASWCRELFDLASTQLPAGNLRQHAQASAAMSTSLSDPDTGLAMLQQVDITNSNNDERAQAARIVFQSVVRRRGFAALPDLLSTAAALGDSGAYPYFATSILVYGGGAAHNFREAAAQSYTEAQTDGCNQVLQQGLTYFKKQSMNAKLDFQFMTLLRAAAFSGCPSSYLLHQAATDFADELVKVETAALNGDEKVRVQAAKNLYDAGSRMLQEIDPVLANSVEKKVGSVRDLKAPQSAPDSKPTTSDWKNDPEAMKYLRRVEENATILNKAPDGSTPHTPEMADAIRNGLEAAQKLADRVAEIDPEAAKPLQRGGGNLPTLLDAAMRIWPDFTISQIENMPDGELKAFLLLKAASYVSINAQRQEMRHELQQ